LYDALEEVLVALEGSALAFPALIDAFLSAMICAKVGGRSGLRFAPRE